MYKYNQIIYFWCWKFGDLHLIIFPMMFFFTWATFHSFLVRDNYSLNLGVDMVDFWWELLDFTGDNCVLLQSESLERFRPTNVKSQKYIVNSHPPTQDTVIHFPSVLSNHPKSARKNINKAFCGINFSCMLCHSYIQKKRNV